MNHQHNQTARHLQRGFSIIEALIAGLVLSFGTLALVGAQVALSRTSDLARQRTEATRLAQEKMEELRAFGSTGTVTGVLTYDTVVSDVTPDTLGTADGYNATFTRGWTVTASPSDLRRDVRVTVTWNDRGGQQQTVRLSSVIAQARLEKVAEVRMQVSSPPGPAGRRQRDNNVPYPALDIPGTDRSAWRWPIGTNQPWYVFDNNNADVLYRCTTGNSTPTATDLENAAVCTRIRGYILAGYISVAPPNGNGNSSNFDAQIAPWVVDRCSILTPTNIDTNSPPCFVAPLIISSQINPACPYIAGSGTVDSGEERRLSYYKCYAYLIQVTGTDTGWGGKLEFSNALNLAGPTGNNKVCRYNNNQLMNTSTGFYTNIRVSLNNENYFARTSGNCETGQQQHQP